MTAMNVGKENTVHKHTTLLAVYVSAVDTQIKLAAVIVHGVVRENTSLTMRVPKVNMMILMTVINAPMEGTVHNNTILLVVTLVPQVNTCQVAPPAIMRAHQTVKYVSAVDTQIKMASVVVSGVVRENTSPTI